MKVLVLVAVLVSVAQEISAGCDSRCEPYNAEFLGIFEDIRPITETVFYETELLQAYKNIPVDTSNADKIKTIEEELARVFLQLDAHYQTIATLISNKLVDMTDIGFIKLLLQGETLEAAFPYDCILQEIAEISIKMKFLREDSIRFANLLKDLACTKEPLSVTPDPSGC